MPVTPPEKTQAEIELKLHEAKTNLEAKKHKFDEYRAKLKTQFEEKESEVKLHVEEWKTSRKVKKLEHRADKAEDYAATAIYLAMAMMEEALYEQPWKRFVPDSMQKLLRELQKSKTRLNRTNCNNCNKGKKLMAYTHTNKIDLSKSLPHERNAVLDAKKIQVETFENKVVLSGKVRNYTERDEAERVAWSAPGVFSVDNQLAVNSSFSAD
jgi:hypothetical protein